MKKIKQKDRKFGAILGINVLVTSRQRVLTAVEGFLTHNVDNNKNKAKLFIVTPNPELVLMAQTNEELKTALNSADMPVPDGVGLSHAYSFLQKSMPRNVLARFFYGLYYGLRLGTLTITGRVEGENGLNIIKGRVLFGDLIELADKLKYKVFLLGGFDNEAQECAKVLSLNHKNTKFESFSGPILNKYAEPATEVDKKLQKDAVDRINKFKPDMLFVAFENPKQEIWIKRNLTNLNTRLAMTVGGTFRYVAGHRRLPTSKFEDSGLEWLWRLITEPKRFKRVWNAFPVFPLRIFITKIKSNL